MLKQATPETITHAAQLLRDGGLVAFPTETVYGLGADATNGHAVARIYEAKGRPSFNPLIVHVASLHDAEKYAVFNDTARLLTSIFWPGALTLVLPLHDNAGISPLVTAGLPTVALRMPSHPVALSILKACDKPIAAPSANLSGRLSPTTALHVVQSLGDTPDLILAGGMATVGLESTVVDLTTPMPTILRHGGITQDMLERALGQTIATADKADKNGPKAPGMLAAHYAPGVPVRLNAVDVAPNEALLAFGSTKFMAVRGVGGVDKLPDDAMRNLSPSGDLTEAAAKLFLYLHELDKPDFQAIAVMNIPSIGVGVAINDRLTRAAASAA